MAKRVLVFGDSITQGFNDTEGGYAERLKKVLLKKFGYIGVFNLGISGDKVDDVLKRFEAEVNARLKSWDSFEETMIIIAIGANDIYVEGDSSKPVTSKQEFIDRFTKLLNLAKGKGKYVLVCSILPFDETKSTPVSWKDISYFDEFAEEYNVEIKRLCEQKSAIYIDTNSAANKIDWPSMIDDGAHPTPAGHEWIYEQVKPYVLKVLEKQ